LISDHPQPLKHPITVALVAGHDLGRGHMPGPQGQRCRESGHPAPLQAPLGPARPDSHAICAYPCAPRSGTQPGMTAFRRPLLRRRWKFCCSDAMALAAHALTGLRDR